MRFALLGDHPDGLNAAEAFSKSGRHTVVAYCGHPEGAASLNRRGMTVRSHEDIEEVLADPSIDAVIVASRPNIRAAQLRRALQSERHVLCVHPVESTLDPAYEAAMLQADIGRVLLPILVEGLHPAIQKLAHAARIGDEGLGAIRLVQVERHITGDLMNATETSDAKASFPGWDALTALGGDLAEVYAFARAEEVAVNEPVLLGGRFDRGGLFQATFVPRQSRPSCRWNVIGANGKAELEFADGVTGPASLTWRRDADAEPKREQWEAWNPGPRLVELFEAAVAAFEASGRAKPNVVRPSWHDAVRCLELDDAARRSIARRRTSTMEYQDASEEVGFKGTMTLVGCGMLWAIIGLAVGSRWLPWLGWGIIPILAAFLIMQTLRWLVPRAK